MRAENKVMRAENEESRKTLLFTIEALRSADEAKKHNEDKKKEKVAQYILNMANSTLVDKIKVIDKIVKNECAVLVFLGEDENVKKEMVRAFIDGGGNIFQFISFDYLYN